MIIDCSNVPDPNETIDFKGSLKKYYKEFVEAKDHEVKRTEKPIEKPVIYVYNFRTKDNLINLKGMPAIIIRKYHRKYIVEYIDENGYKTGELGTVGMTEGVPYSRMLYLNEDNQERAEQIIHDYYKQHEEQRIEKLTNNRVYVVTYVKEDHDMIFGVFTSLEKATDAIKEKTGDPDMDIFMLEMDTIRIRNGMTNYYISSLELNKEV